VQVPRAAFKAALSAGANAVIWYWLQVFIEDVQNKPLDDVQSLVPHAQLSELTAVPSSTEQDAYWLQVFIEDVQNKPLDDVQSLVPHAQLSELTAVPSSTEHDAYW
jgi:phospholipase C